MEPGFRAGTAMPPGGWLVMQLYHFDLVDSENVTDVNGAILHDDDQARKVAVELAQAVREGRPELIGLGFEILVRGENGAEISRISVDQPPYGKISS
jgi:uncharacterized protein DUF6894